MKSAASASSISNAGGSSGEDSVLYGGKEKRVKGSKSKNKKIVDPGNWTRVISMSAGGL